MPLCFAMSTKRAKSRGVTLVELVVAVLIVAILAAIAFPSYQSYAKRARRSAAQAYLLDLAQRQQDYLLNARAYAARVSMLNSPAPQTVSPYYAVSLATSTGSPAGFTITATPVSGTAQAGDVTLTVHNTGVKNPAVSQCVVIAAAARITGVESGRAALAASALAVWGIGVTTAMRTLWEPAVRLGMPLPRSPAPSALCAPAVGRTCRSIPDRYDSGLVLACHLLVRCAAVGLP